MWPWCRWQSSLVMGWFLARYHRIFKFGSVQLRGLPVVLLSSDWPKIAKTICWLQHWSLDCLRCVTCVEPPRLIHLNPERQHMHRVCMYNTCENHFCEVRMIDRLLLRITCNRQLWDTRCPCYNSTWVRTAPTVSSSGISMVSIVFRKCGLTRMN